MFYLCASLIICCLGYVHGAFSCKDVRSDYSAPVCIEDGYDIFRLPFTDKPNKISVTMDVDSVIGIDEKEFSFSFVAYFNLQWNEPRLVAQNDNQESTAMLPVDAGIIKELWMPNVFLYNLKSFEVMEVLSKLSGVWVNNDKDVLYSQATHMKIFCTMDFTWFPFDTQICHFRAGSYSYNDQKMTFTSESSMVGKPTKINPLPYVIGKSFCLNIQLLNKNYYAVEAPNWHILETL